jgi:uncharacterized membrane protein (DUF485 family)
VATDSATRLRELTRARRRISTTLTVVMIVLYFGFIGLIAFDKQLLARKLTAGLSLGIVLGALVIVISWLLTFWYVRWANANYDTVLRDIDRGGAA